MLEFQPHQPGCFDHIFQDIGAKKGCWIFMGIKNGRDLPQFNGIKNPAVDIVPHISFWKQNVSFDLPLGRAVIFKGTFEPPVQAFSHFDRSELSTILYQRLQQSFCGFIDNKIVTSVIRDEIHICCKFFQTNWIQFPVF
ncbi:hypothetical protein HK23_14525 [Acetobacter malorum]|uniref:Uncharacterized protein n=1 Tax=Acetobacter malorum TaxID=178901 RepID=A0A1Y3G8A7_9PROT|nr:hypothetical protein HK23_14525 [Acetobacter malorum]